MRKGKGVSLTESPAFAQPCLHPCGRCGHLLWQAVYLLVKADDLFDAAFHFFLKTNSKTEESHEGYEKGNLLTHFKCLHKSNSDICFD